MVGQRVNDETGEDIDGENAARAQVARGPRDRREERSVHETNDDGE